jgi:hypothetical protein
MKRKMKVVILLLALHCAQVSLTSAQSADALFEAIRKDDPEAVKRTLLHPDSLLARSLLRLNSHPVSTAGWEGARAALDALTSKSIDGVEYPVAVFSIDAQDSGGNTALLHTARKGHIETVSFLLERGANVTLVNSVMETAVRCAFLRGKTDVVRLLVVHIRTQGKLEAYLKFEADLLKNYAALTGGSGKAETERIDAYIQQLRSIAAQ